MKHPFEPSFGTVFGCDPEIFVTRASGRVRKRRAAVGSERFLPPAGIYGDGSGVTRDGVQAELHITPGGCRQGAAGRLASAMTLLNAAVEAARAELRIPSLAVTFKPMISLTPADLRQLSPEARQLNCKPSLNAYGRKQVIVDGNTYTHRTASGHIHLGTGLITKKLVDPVDVVKILDVLVGIPTVLIDRDPSQIIRREIYGLAGEYRLPKHGLEYRVPSNFWLLDYKLASMIFGLARLAANVAEGFIRNSRQQWAKDALLDRVDFDKVQQAINTNDVDIALCIYKESIRPFAEQLPVYYSFGSGTVMDNFEYFIDQIHDGGLRRWFKTDDSATLDRWMKLDTSIGWERFLSQEVLLKRAAARFIGIIVPAASTGTVVRRHSREDLPIAA